MRIAFVCYKYFPYGGLQRDLVRIGQACQKLGHQIHLVVKEWSEGEVPEGFTREVLPSKGFSNHQQCLSFANNLQNWLAEQSFDYVVGFNKLPGLDAYYAADRCYAEKMQNQHGAWYRLTPRYKVFAGLEKRVLQANADTQVLLIAEREKLVFQRHYQTAESRFHLLPPGISRDRIAPDNANQLRVSKRHEMKWQPHEKIILLIGSGFKTKGLDRAIKAVAGLSKEKRDVTKLFVVGRDKFTKYGLLAKKLGAAEQVIHLGGRDDVSALLLAADLLIHPAYNENTGTVLLEAMCAGLPVLATDECGYASYVEEANAGVIHRAPFSLSRLVSELDQLLFSDDAKAQGANGLAYAKSHDLYSLPESAAKLIDQLARQKSHG